MDVSQLYGRDKFTTCGQWSRIGSVELWNIKVVKPTGSYWGDLWRRMCRLSLRSQSRRHLIVTNWAAAVVHQCEHVNTHRWTTFQLLSLWLSMSTGLTSNDTCVVISRLGLPQSLLNTSADHLNDQLTITVFFLSRRMHIYTINCSHLQLICMCF